MTKKAKISTNAMANLGRNESIPLQTLEKICAVLECSLDDIVEFSEDEKKYLSPLVREVADGQKE